MRVGIASGPATGGVVGSSMLRYHLFGPLTQAVTCFEQAAPHGGVLVSAEFVNALLGLAEGGSAPSSTDASSSGQGSSGSAFRVQTTVVAAPSLPEGPVGWTAGDGITGHVCVTFRPRKAGSSDSAAEAEADPACAEHLGGGCASSDAAGSFSDVGPISPKCGSAPFFGPFMRNKGEDARASSAVGSNRDPSAAWLDGKAGMAAVLAPQQSGRSLLVRIRGVQSKHLMCLWEVVPPSSWRDIFIRQTRVPVPVVSYRQLLNSSAPLVFHSRWGRRSTSFRPRLCS